VVGERKRMGDAAAGGVMGYHSVLGIAGDSIEGRKTKRTKRRS
jgi:hypothetical protein